MQMLKMFAAPLLLLAVVLLPAAASGLPPTPPPSKYALASLGDEWRWVEYTRESGLPANAVYRIAETRDGKVWAATREGLAWYDGFQWRLVPESRMRFARQPRYLYPYADSSLVVGTADGIWIVTVSGAEPYRSPVSGEPEVLFALRLPNGDDLVQTSGGLYQVRDGAARSITPPSAIPPPLYLHVSVTGSGMVWITTATGLFSWDGWRWTQWMKTPARASFEFRAVGELPAGRAIVSVLAPLGSRGIWELDGAGGGRRLLTNGAEVMRLVDTAPDGEVIGIFESGEMTLYDGRAWSLVTALPARLRNVSFLKFRADGDLWIATDAGLFLFRASAGRWRYWKHPFPDLRNVVNEILRARDGSFWLGTSGGIEIRRPDGTSTMVTRIGTTAISGVTGLGEDERGEIWVSSGSDFQGAFCWNGSSWRHAGEAEGLGGVTVHRIRKDLDGRLWFLGISPRFGVDEPGAFVLDHGVFTRWGVSEGLLNGRVYSFAESPDGSLWFGTLHGVSRWRNGGWKHWRVGRELHGGRIFAMAADHAGRVWFDDGLGLVSIDSGDVPVYAPDAAELGGKDIWDMRFDDAGTTLWLTSRNAGSVIRFHDGVAVTFGPAEGLNNANPWPVLPVGDTIYIGTDGGGVNLLTLHPEGEPAPRIVFTQPSLEEAEAHLSWSAYSWWGEVPPAEIRTRYRLDDGTWSSWSTRHAADFSRLGTGAHTLRVRAQGPFGAGAGGEAALDFRIEPPLYARPLILLPFFLLTAAVGSLSVLLVSRRRKHLSAMHDRDAKMRMAMEMTASAIFIFRDGRIRFANSAAERLTGYSRAELEARGFSPLTPRENGISGGTTAGTAAPNKDESGRSELTIQTKDGAKRWIEYTLRPILFEDGPAHLGTAFDISERKRAEAQLIAYRDKLKYLASELLLTEERERRKMAEYLHDTISQGLAFCKMKLAALRECESPEELRRLVQEINTLVTDSIGQAQTLTFELSPPVLYELGFTDAVEWLAERMGKQYLLSVGVRSENLPDALGADIRIVLFHAIRESLVNVAKHAQTGSARVDVRREGDELVVTVTDGGRGFDVHASGQATSREGGFGLFNVRERLSQFGGSLEITSAPGKGTVVTMRAPLDAEAGRAGREH